MAFTKDTKLSDHFKVSEFIRTSQDAKKKPNPKYPNIKFTNAEFVQKNIEYCEKNQEALTGLCINILEPLRAHMKEKYGFTSLKINSGMRCPELNSYIGGAATSQHTHCEAADVHCGDCKTLKQIFLDIANNKVKGLNMANISQCICERKASAAGGHSYWLHIAFSSKRWKEYKKSKGVKEVKPEFMLTLTGKAGSYLPLTKENLAKFV